MTITREDILRELELLPVWTLHPSFKAAQAVSSSTDMHPAEVLAITETVPEDATSNSMSEVALPVIHDTIAEPVVEAKVVEAKVAVTWLLYCPLDVATDQEALTLLHNMVRAMQLLSTEYQLIHTLEALARYQPTYMLIFGLNAAHAVLDKALTFEDTKEQPYMHAQRHCWVVHHPKQLMENPSLKREAWHTMCAAKAFAQKV
jgi:uracil-DNA glycosylase